MSEINDEIAARGLLHRRTLLRGGMFAAGAGIAQADNPDWMKTPGRTFSAYGMPAKVPG